MKKFYVYLITNKILNKQYVGSRTCELQNLEEDEYWGSSKYLNEDYKIYGKENFIKEIISCSYNNKNELLEGETFYILKYNTLAPYGYNRFLPNERKGFRRDGCKHSEETKEKIRIKTKESCKNMNSGEKNPMFGKSNYDIWLKKYGKEIADNKQKKRDHKHSLSMMGVHKGKKLTESHKINMSKSRIGKPHPQKKIKCPVCGYETITSNFNRYHSKRCNFKI